MISLNGMMSPNNHMDRAMGIIAVGALVVSAGVGIYGANKNANTAEGIATADRIQRDKEAAKLEKQKEVYRKMEFKNPFENMENKYEDLTVNQQQAEFQSQQGDQQRANIMQGLRGAAGSSGIAGLAQAMANQGQLQTQRISASIGMQESRNKLAVAGASSSIQSAERQGDQYVQQAQMDRQATLLGMQAGQTAGANLAFQQSQANQMNAQIAQTQAITDGVTGIVQTGIGAQQAGMFSK